MRTREKQRIFKRFMGGESIALIAYGVANKNKTLKCEDILTACSNVEQAIRECVNEIKKGEK